MKFKFLIGLAILSFASLQAQITNDSILKDFDNFMKIPESNVYMHLNKSILLEGETLGFSAYVMDHKKQIPSQIVKNLYCQILNSEGKVIKEQMMIVENGKTDGVFAIDSIMPSGNYSVRGFTNWMKNFKSPHYFEAPIRIINATGKITKNNKNKPVVVHILPESGHLVENVLTRVGLKIDSEKSLNDKQIVLVIDGKVAEKIKLNHNGVGRFVIRPQLNSKYEIRMESTNELLLDKFPVIDRHGVVMSVNQINSKVSIGLSTNQESLDNMPLNNLSVLVNSNGKLHIYDIEMNDKDVQITLDNKKFSPGVNQITLLSEKKNVISKRLIFNYENFDISGVTNSYVIKELDSLKTTFEFDNVKKAQLSISVHPVNTISTDRSQSIVSTFKLNPYLYDNIVNPSYYFKNVDKKKKYEMDNLMLCLGWEMYDWSFIFKKNKILNYNFESGIAVNAQINKSEIKRFLVYPGRNSGTSFINPKKDDDSFFFENYFPTTGEKLKISDLNKKGQTSKANLYLQFSPNKIPDFDFVSKVKYLEFASPINDVNFKPFSKNSEELDLIVLTAKKNEKREAKIRNKARGRIDFFSDNDRRKEVSILQYVLRNGLKATNANGDLAIISQRLQIGQASPEPMSIILNGTSYLDANVLQGFSMSSVDYIEIDESGLLRAGTGGSGKNGYLIIKTDPLLDPYSKKYNDLSSYDVPLTFATPEKFFTPSYYSYTDDFFDKLGVVDWQGDLEVVDGKTSFTMPYLGKDKLLFHIQGWTEQGELIDDYKIVEVNK